MAKQKNLILKIGLKYGLAGGIINVLFYLAVYGFGKNPLNPEIRYVMDAFLLILFLTMATIEYWYTDSYYRFWKYMSVGIINNLW